MAENFYQLLRQRIAEHAERDLARYHIDLKVPEPKTPPRQRKWLDKFKRIHGMSYSTWLYKKKHGLINEPTPELPEPTESLQEAHQDIVTQQALPSMLPVPITTGCGKNATF